jgi:hypothetical protein
LELIAIVSSDSGETTKNRQHLKSGSGVRRDKAALSSGCKSHPATAPAGASKGRSGSKFGLTGSWPERPLFPGADSPASGPRGQVLAIGLWSDVAMSLEREHLPSPELGTGVLKQNICAPRESTSTKTKRELPMIDRTSKILLALIALGLWANILLVLLGPNAAIAQSVQNAQRTQSTELQTMALDVHNIESDVSSISTGVCSNRTLCSAARTP